MKFNAGTLTKQEVEYLRQSLDSIETATAILNIEINTGNRESRTAFLCRRFLTNTLCGIDSAFGADCLKAITVECVIARDKTPLSEYMQILKNKYLTLPE